MWSADILLHLPCNSGFEHDHPGGIIKPFLGGIISHHNLASQRKQGIKCYIHSGGDSAMLIRPCSFCVLSLLSLLRMADCGMHNLHGVQGSATNCHRAEGCSRTRKGGLPSIPSPFPPVRIRPEALWTLIRKEQSLPAKTDKAHRILACLQFSMPNQ
jgi:hypothetical protein